MTQCKGCGAVLQTTQKEQVGYIPESKIDGGICQRCFQLRHYNASQVSVPTVDFLEILDETLVLYPPEETLIVYLVDLLDLGATFLPGSGRRFREYPIVVVANKLDLLPSTVNFGRIRRWINKTFSEELLTPQLVWLTSAKEKQGLELIIQELQTEYRSFKNLLVIGTTNVGKSTFVNALKHQSVENEQLATVSNVPGTTLLPIVFPLNATQQVIDTPGIMNKAQLVHLLSYESQRMITPKGRLKPRVFQIYEPTTFFIEGLGMIDYQGTDAISLVFYFANELTIHRTKFTNRDKILQNKTLFSIPSEDDLITTMKKRTKLLNLKQKKMDCVIAGLGFFTIHGQPSTLSVTFPENVNIELRESLM